MAMKSVKNDESIIWVDGDTTFYMDFVTENGNTVTVTVKRVKADISATEITNAENTGVADLIIASGHFGIFDATTGSNDLVNALTKAYTKVESVGTFQGGE